MPCLRSFLYGVFALILCTPLQAQFTLNGTAVALGNDCYRLTNNAPTQAGSVWYNTLIDLDQSFTLYFTINLGSQNGNGADGMAFVLQNQNTSIGSNGGGLGYQGINPSFAVEFDTYQNFSDPSFDHVAIQRNGDLNHNGPNNLDGPVQALPTSTNIEDGQDHDLKISWDTTSNRLEVYVDCSLRVSYVGDIVQTIFQGNNLVFWGFTAATGALFNQQSFCVDYISFEQELNDTTICVGDSVQLDAELGTTYAWAPVTGLDDPNIQSPKASPPSTTTYTVTVTDNCGQSRTDQVTITVETPATISLPADTTVCQGTPVSITATVGNSTDLLWNTGAPTNTIVATQPGIYFADAWNGTCTVPVRDSMEIFWEAPISVTLPDDDTVCVGDGVLVNGTTPGATGYQWSTGQTNPFLFIDSAGTYTLTVQSQYCPAVSDQYTLFTRDSLTLDLGEDQTICEINSIILLADHPEATSVSWSTGESTPTITVQQAGLYAATLSGRFCPDVQDSMRLITVPVPQVDLGEDWLICEGDSVVLDATSPNVDSYRWNNGLTEPVITARTRGAYQVTVANGYCPSASDEVLIEFEYPVETGTFPDSVIFCPGDFTQIGGILNHATSYQWNTGGVEPEIAVNSPGLYVVTGSNQSCGSLQDSVYVSFSTPQADFLYFTDPAFADIVIGEPVFFEENSQNAGAFQWIFPDQFGIDEEASLTHVFAEPGTYEVTLIVTDTLDLCQDSVSYPITIFEPSIYIPTAFTPNQDGDNDQWLMKGTGIIQVNVQIFNRWGLRIYSATSLADGWNGHSTNGSPQPEGVYTYAVEGRFQSGRLFRQTGTITLIR